MHSYSHHIKDFNNSTKHLTHVERALYRELIEYYYDTEAPLKSDIKWLQRRVSARSDEEKQAVIDVLDEFFHLANDVYVHHRCEEEILKYRNTKTQKSKAGKASAAAKKKRREERVKEKSSIHNSNSEQKATPVQQPLNICSTEGQLTNNHKPDNHKPNLSNKDKTLLFDRFYGHYPKKRGKGQAKKTFAKLNPSEELVDEMIRVIDIFKKTDDWLKDNGSFIPHPSSWLNNEGWLDQVDTGLSPQGETFATPEEYEEKKAKEKYDQEFKELSDRAIRFGRTIPSGLSFAEMEVISEEIGFLELEEIKNKYEK